SSSSPGSEIEDEIGARGGDAELDALALRVVARAGPQILDGAAALLAAAGMADAHAASGFGRDAAALELLEERAVAVEAERLLRARERDGHRLARRGELGRPRHEALDGQAIEAAGGGVGRGHGLEQALRPARERRAR